jgi:hypothetical protein
MESAQSFGPDPEFAPPIRWTPPLENQKYRQKVMTPWGGASKLMAVTVDCLNPMLKV